MYNFNLPHVIYITTTVCALLGVTRQHIFEGLQVLISCASPLCHCLDRLIQFDGEASCCTGKTPTHCPHPISPVVVWRSAAPPSESNFLLWLPWSRICSQALWFAFVSLTISTSLNNQNALRVTCDSGLQKRTAEHNYHFVVGRRAAKTQIACCQPATMPRLFRLAP